MRDTLIQFAESWWPLYAVHVLETSLFILIVWAVDRFVNLDTRLRYSLWLCALVKAFVPPFYAVPLPAFLSATPEPVASFVPQSAAVWEPVPFDFTPVALPPEPLPLAFWVFALWSCSVLGFVGVTLWRNRVFQSALGIANPVELSADLEDLTKGAKLRVFSKANLNSPLLVGVMKPRLYLPSTWQNWTPAQLRGVVAHELAHYHNRDLWTLSFQVMATVLFGLNPLSWLVNRRLAHLRELRCDEVALQKSGISPVEYSKLLYAFLDAKAHPGLPALGFTEKDTPLKKRFEHVLNFKGGNMKRSKWQLAIPVLVALAIVPFSIRETYSQATLQPQVERLRSQQELISKGSYGMMFKKRLLEVKRDLVAVTAPDYPDALSGQGIEGQIELALVVDSDGRVEQVTRIGGDARFEQATVDALKQARFRPSETGESTTLKQTVLFKVKDDNGLVIELPETFWNGSDLGEMVVWAKSSNANGGATNFQIKPTKQIPPRYPENLRMNGVEGYVLMEVTINANGRVGDVRLLEGDAQFEPAAQVALKQFRYTPFTHAPSVNKTQIFVFKLASDNHHVYDPSEDVMKKSDFGPMVVIANAPTPGDRQENGTGLDVRETGLVTQIAAPITPKNIDGHQIMEFYLVDQKPKSLTHVKPVHPANAQGQTDKIFLKFLINTDGSISHVTVLRGKEVFHQAAIDAVSQSTYQPAQHQGQVVPVWMTMPVMFKPGGAQASRAPESPMSGIVSEIWINTQGDLLIDLSKSVAMANIVNELALLKQKNNTQMIRVKADTETPKAAVQELVKKIQEAGLKAFVARANVVGKGQPLDPDNIQFYQVSVKPEAIQTARPVYPEIARVVGLTGKVFLKFRVNVDGSVSDVEVLKGTEVFKESAIEAIQKFRFKPAEHEGKPVAVWMTLPVNFQLQSGTPLIAQQVDLPAFTVKVPNGQGGLGNAQPKLTLTVISEGAAGIIKKDVAKAQQAARVVLSQTPFDQWATPEQQTSLLNGVRDQINSIYKVPLVTQVTFSDLLISPTDHVAENHAFKLHSNFPNPFNPQTSIKYEVAEPVFVRMEIYNVTGQVIRTLVAKDHPPGQYETRWDGKNGQGNPVASGVYYYHINAGSFNAVNKMQLVK